MSCLILLTIVSQLWQTLLCDVGVEDKNAYHTVMCHPALLIKTYTLGVAHWEFGKVAYTVTILMEESEKTLPDIRKNSLDC